jgi:hypothetical protein
LLVGNQRRSKGNRTATHGISATLGPQWMLRSPLRPAQ